MNGTRTIRGIDLTTLLGAVRDSLGEDAVILETRSPAETDGTHFELLVAPAGWKQAPDDLQATAARIGGPYVIALVGPPGAGKSTLAAKLALNPSGFGGRDVGLLTLDTYKAGAVDQLFVFAEIADLPLEVAYDADEAKAAMGRLGARDVVIVDTPGRGMRDPAQQDWHETLAALHPHETHLVLPAWIRPEIARTVSEAHRSLDPEQLIVTMVDQVTESDTVDTLVMATGLTVRWWSDGPAVPEDLAELGVWSAATTSALAWAS